MRLMTNDSARLTDEFGINVGRWTQYDSASELPFGAMWCVVPPGGRSNIDQHPDRELFVVVSGTGEVETPGGDKMPVAPGSAVLMESQEPHILVNSSSAGPLIALSVYWMPEELSIWRSSMSSGWVSARPI